MENIKEILTSIVEQADCDKPTCKNCVSYKNGGCSFGCLNERLKLTTPNYSCDNFKAVYDFKESTFDALRDILNRYKKLNESLKNIKLLIDGKISEEEFIDLID